MVNTQPRLHNRSRIALLGVILYWLAPLATLAQTSTMQYVNGQPAYMSNQLLVSFGPNQVKTEAVNNASITSGVLSTFLKPSALASIQQQTGLTLTNAPTEKIFNWMRSGDSLSIARTGDTVKVFPFWATFKVYLTPPTENLAGLCKLSDTLRSVYPVVLGSSLNVVLKADAVANDPRYATEQLSLHLNTSPAFYFPNSHINLPGAWSMHHGSPTIKVGVLDTGIRWTHEDFGAVV